MKVKVCRNSSDHDTNYTNIRCVCIADGELILIKAFEGYDENISIPLIDIMYFTSYEEKKEEKENDN